MVSTTSEASVFATNPTWHDPTDVQVRKIMMARLRSHPALAQHHPILHVREDTGTSPSLLQRLEWMLYHSAGSLSEYLHQPSLERRVQGLVTRYKRKRSEHEPSETIMASIRACAAKRQRPQLTITEEEIRNCSVGARGCVLNSNLDLLHHVCSFLDGKDVLRCRAVNKSLYLHAPSFVRSLHIDATSVPVTETRNRGDGAASGLSSLLHECKNLTSLTISNQTNQTHLKSGVVFPRALAASTYMASLATASYGHQLVREVANAFEAGACPSLERLELLAPFDFAAENDAVLAVLQALTETNVQHRRRKPLHHLVLDATFLGDRGIEQLAELFETKDTFFEHLQTLVVRNNFMGETGCRALLEAIESFGELQTLDLSRNILTDTDAFALADLLDDPVTDMSLCDCMESDRKTSSVDEAVPEQFNVLGLAGLRTLKLQENFITCDGFHAITIALCSREGFVATVGDTTDHSERDELDEDDEDEVEEVLDVDQEH